MLYTIIIMLKGASSIIRRININALYSPSIVLL